MLVILKKSAATGKKGGNRGNGKCAPLLEKGKCLSINDDFSSQPGGLKQCVKIEFSMFHRSVC